MILDLA
ncbi:Protein of unknown function [Bacillus mobilis]|nr:Protein of unknown function [Bacillus mobilis]